MKTFASFQLYLYICRDSSKNNYMKYTISFIKNDVAYYATVFEFVDGSYEVLDFYYVENYKSINTDWKQFKSEIEALIL